MKQAEYIGEVLEEGDLSLPESVRKQLDLQPAARVRVVLFVPDADQQAMTEAWDLFRQMGRQAGGRRLADAAAEHDRYLYGRSGA